ncbi:MAG: CCA tRNA nucleotidyltransferase [Allobranchiibius sp.]
MASLEPLESPQPPSASQLTVLREQAVLRLAPVLATLRELGELFADGGHELSLVGGPVRDAFLGRDLTDVDLTTSASPEQSEELLTRWGGTTWDIGRAFGTIGAHRRGTQVEVTTYRADSYDRTTRKPQVAFGNCLEDDLRRRDFTVNAMALRLPQLEFVDPYGGLLALAARMLDTPATPQESFADDPLRMMRAARFTAQLDFDLAPRVRAAIPELAEQLAMVSAERVREELVKLLAAQHPVKGLRVLTESGLADVMLPELPALRLEVDEHHHHKDVYEHSLTVLTQAIELEGPRVVAGLGQAVPVAAADITLRLAALLHDIGKPATRRFERNGGVSFHHHEVVGAKLARRRMKALRFSRDEIRDVTRLVELHLRFHGYGGGEWTDSAVRRYITDAGPLLSRLHLLTRADCTTRNRRKAESLARTYDDLEVRIGSLLAREKLDAVRPELDGNQIAVALNIAPGPVLGRAYKHMLAYRLDQGEVGEPAAVDELRRWWTQQPESAS